MKRQRILPTALSASALLLLAGVAGPRAAPAAAGPDAADRMIRTAAALLDTLGTALDVSHRRGW